MTRARRLRLRSHLEPLEARIAPASISVINLNSLNGSNGFTITGGTNTGSIVDNAYDSIANAGDVNGDGIDDLIIGSTSYVQGNSTLGVAAIVFGKTSGFPTNIDLNSLGTAGVLIKGQGSNFGASVSAAGDVNGDGFGDVIIGATGGAADEGFAYVVFGKTNLATFNVSTLDGTNGFRVVGDNRNFAAFAAHVGGGRVSGEGRGGDYNGDGFDDVLIGAETLTAFTQNQGGGVFVVFGKASGFTASINTANINGTNGTLIASNLQSEHLGAEVGYIGDVNQDGRDDIAIGNVSFSFGYQSDKTRALVIFGQATSTATLNVTTGLSAAKGFEIPPAPANDSGNIHLPGTKLTMRDIDGDGDLDLGMPWYFTFTKKEGPREGYAWAKNTGSGFAENPFEHPENLTRHVFIDPKDSSVFDPYGNTTASDALYDPGDFDGDGTTDYFAYLRDTEGLDVSIYKGTQKSGTFFLNGAASADIITLQSSELNYVSGQIESVQFIGDLNGDGLDDVLLVPPKNQVAAEAVVVFGTNLEGSKDGKTFTYTDVDGDLVTVKTTKGALDPVMFHLGSAPGAVHGGKQLQLLDLTPAIGVDGFDPTGATITITAKRGPLGGDGFVNVGAINAAGLNLGAVTVAGDLGHITAGTDAEDKAAITTLTVNSLGRLGTSTQAAGGSLQSAIKGPLNKLVVKHDIDGALVNVLGTDGTIGSVSVGHSLIGGVTAGAGEITAAGAIGNVTVGGNLIGGSGANSGSIIGASLGKVSVKGSVIGGTGDQSGLLSSLSTIGAVTIGHDVRGDSASASKNGAITANGAIASVKISGNLIGGAGALSGAISTFTSLGAVTIGGNLEAGGNALNGIVAGGSLGAVKISGSVFGTAAAPALISSGKDENSSALKSVSVDGSVHFATVRAGFDTTGAALPAVDAQIGAVTVKGDWIGSSIAAGVRPGLDGKWGTADDAVIPGVDAKTLSRIASITISGEARGTDGGTDSFAFTAEEIGAFTIGKTKIPLAKASTSNTAEEEFGIGATFDVRLRELDATAPAAPLTLAAYIGPAPTASEDGKTVTFFDVDGDLVTVKTDKGRFDAALSNFEFTGPNGGWRIENLRLSGDTDFIEKNASITITAKRSENGGDGWVDVGTIDARGLDLAKVTISGDLGEIDGGSGAVLQLGAAASASPVAISTLSVHSLGGRGIATGNTGSLASVLAGALNTLSVDTDLTGASVIATGKIGTVSVHGSLLGGTEVEAGSVHSLEAIGKATISGDLRGSNGENSGALISGGALGAVTVNGNLRGGSGATSGAILANLGSGAITVKHSVSGATGVNSGSIVVREGSLPSVKISGDLIGGGGNFSGSILTSGSADLGAIGKVTVSGSVFATTNDFTGIFSSSTLGPVSISGDVRGSAGASVKIVAEGVAAPASASKAVAVKSLTISGEASRLDVLAGYDSGLHGIRADAQIGAVTAKGDWVRGNVLAGVLDSAAPISVSGTADIAARIASITISGAVFGTPGANPGATYLFSAEEIGSFKTGNASLPLTKDRDDLALPAAPDVRVREVLLLP